MRSIISLDTYKEKVYNMVLFSITKGREEFTVHYPGNVNDILSIIKVVLGEFGEYFYYNNCSINYMKNGVNITIKLSKWVRGYNLRKYVDAFSTESQKIIESVISSNMNDMQKALALHNYLINNVIYADIQTVKSNYQKLHTAYGAIVDRYAVCEGISAAYCHLLRLVGIRATIVNGSTERSMSYDHCWNIIEIDNAFYHIDVTWDLKNKNECNYNNLDYFALKDVDLNNRIWNKTIYPKCNSDNMNFFYLSKSIVNSENELINVAIRQSLKGKSIYLKCLYLKNFQDEQEVCDYIFDLIRNNKRLSANMRGQLTCSVNLDQLTVYVKCT